MGLQSTQNDEGPLIGALLRACWQAVRARIQRDLIADGFDDIGTAHLAVFQYPSPHGVRMTALADRAGMSRQAMSYLIGELEANGYLERRPDPSDARASLVHLTRRGEAAVGATRASVRRLEREWEEELGRSRFGQLRETLLAIARCLG
ncbi:MAG: MarR family transcriptional regulator [Pseudonocardiales bacterium]|nr:MAG: MarR family transcriptional regulator [Pseudonocardiales bacterium]